MSVPVQRVTIELAFFLIVPGAEQVSRLNHGAISDAIDKGLKSANGSIALCAVMTWHDVRMGRREIDPVQEGKWAKWYD
jgi:hypothetical protein